MENEKQAHQIPDTLDVVTLTFRREDPTALQVRGVGTPMDILGFLNKASEIMRAQLAADETMARIAQAETERRIVVPG